MKENRREVVEIYAHKVKEGKGREKEARCRVFDHSSRGTFEDGGVTHC